MWNITKDGFLSVVAYDPAKDRDKNSPFPDIAKQAGTHLLVRARRMEHLEPLKRIVPELTIVDDRSADYRFRSVIKRHQYKKFLCQQVDQIDYWSHFKEAMRDAQPPHLKDGMYRAVMQIWSIFAALQASKPYKGDEQKKAPVSSGVADYQKSKGVQPFASATRSVQTAFGFSDAKGLSLDEVEVMISNRQGSLTFTSAELQKMSDQGFELVTRLQEKYGTKCRVSAPIVSRERQRLEESVK